MTGKTPNPATVQRWMARGGHKWVGGWFKKSKAEKLEAESAKNVAEIMAKHGMDSKDV